MTHLRKLMLDELQRRNYSQNTVRAYIHAIEDFAKYFHRSPDRLGPEHIREYQVHLFRDCKLSPGTIEDRTAALRFLFVKTLRRPYLPDHIPFPKRQRRMPTVLSQEEVSRLIASAQNLMHRTMLMMLYATGLRRAELCHLKVSDIDSERMVIHVRQGKGGRDRDVLLTPKLLETLREYWRWMKPQTYLFPGTVNNWRADVPINTTDVIAAIEDILGMGRLSKFDYFSRSLAEVFAPTPDLTPFDAITPKQDLNEKNPQNTAAARMSEGLDLSAPDRVDDWVYNRILWLMLKGDASYPAARNRAPLHALETSP